MLQFSSFVEPTIAFFETVHHAVRCCGRALWGIRFMSIRVPAEGGVRESSFGYASEERLSLYSCVVKQIVSNVDQKVVFGKSGFWSVTGPAAWYAGYEK